MSDFEVGDRVKVRKLQGEFEVTGSRRVGRVKPRYQMKLIPDTGGLLSETEAFSEDMQLVPAPQPAPELSLAPDPPAANSPAQELRPVAPDAAAPASPGTVAGTVCSPAAGITLSRDPDEPRDPREWKIPVSEPNLPALETNFSLDAGSFGGELDEYSPGAQEVDHTDDPEAPRMLRLRTKEIRYYPAVAMSYRDLKNILYSSYFKGMEKGPYADLDNDTPVGVCVTKETNGAAVWIVTLRDHGEVKEAQLEVFFPADRVQSGPGCEAMAIEHGVLLALRKIPIRRNDLEVLLLQLE